MLLEALASILEVDICPTFDIPLSSVRLGVNISIWTTEGKEIISGVKFKDACRTYVL